MSMTTRVSKAEERLNERLLWEEAERAAAECGLEAGELYREAQEIIARYWHLARRGRGGRLNLDPVMRAMAEDDGLDYKELREEMKQTLRRSRAGERRRRK